MTSARGKRIGVVGAGIAGLVAARTLIDQGHRVMVFDKGRGPGGRASRRRTEGYAFDHGAQYFTARDPGFSRRAQSWLADGVVAEWTPVVGVYEDGRWRRSESVTQRYVGVEGMSGLARHLADGIDVRLGTEVVSADRTGKRWALTLVDESEVGPFDILVIAIPYPQAVKILEPHIDKLAIEDPDMRPCWAVMGVPERRLATEIDAGFVNQGHLRWIARNGSKPGRVDLNEWVLHASLDWSEQHIEDDQGAVVEQLTAEFAGLFGESVDWSFAQAHRWRYALARNPSSRGYYWFEDMALGICGDWCAGQRIEGAYLSGSAMAARLRQSA